MSHEGKTAVAADGNPPPYFHAVMAPHSLNTLPNQSGFRCPCNAVFLGLLRLFAAIQRNLLTINNLQPNSSISN
jgi:hypothetical protein